MADDHAAQATLARLDTVIDDLLRGKDKLVNKYEVCGLLQSIKFEWKEKHVRGKRENDASNNTRQEEVERSPSQRKGSRGRRRARKALAEPQSTASTGSSSPEGRAAPVVSPPAVVDQTRGASAATPITLDEDEKAEKGNKPEERGWSVVARRANKIKPGNVRLVDQKTGGKRAVPKKVPAKLPRSSCVVRIEITQEYDWQERYNLTPAELISEIREVAGDEVANQIGSVRVYEGGNLKITPRKDAVDFQKGLEWMTDWIPSAMPSSLKWWEVIVHGVPQGESADQTQIWIREQNSEAFEDCLLGTNRWLKKANRPGERSGLRIKLSDPTKANELITDGVFLNHYHHRVSRFWEEGPHMGRGKSPYFEVPEGIETEYEVDRMDESDGSSSPSSLEQVLPALPQEGLAQIPAGLEGEGSARESSSDSESRKRPREPSPTGLDDTTKRGCQPTRGRPMGSINQPKFRFGAPKGSHPWAISKGRLNQADNSVESQPSSARGGVEQGRQYPSTQ